MLSVCPRRNVQVRSQFARKSVSFIVIVLLNAIFNAAIRIAIKRINDPADILSGIPQMPLPHASIIFI